MNTETLISNVVEFLRSKITDPIATRTTEWIYPDYPRADAQMPRISVVQVGKGLDIRFVGCTTNDLRELILDIDVWVGKDTKGTQSPFTDKIGTRLREALGDSVESSLLDKRSELHTSYGIIDISTSPFTHPFDEDLGLHRKTITASFSFQRS